MRFVLIAMAASLSIAVPAFAADTVPQTDAQTCVDVQIGNDRTAYLNCLNAAMQRRVEHERATPQIAAPIEANSSSNQVGTFNEAAVREHMGDSYGISPVPQRPARVFANPIAPPTTR